MRTIFALVLAIFTMSCGSMPCGGGMHFHPAFPSSFRPTVAEAVKRWNDFSVEPVAIVPDSTEKQCSIRQASSEEYSEIREKSGFVLVVHRPSEDSMLFSFQNWGPDDLAHMTTAVMHELGHLHRLEHVADPKAIMHSSLTSSDSFNETDLRECRSVGACL